MGFNHGFERKMFNREQRHFMEKCLKAGMSEADIQNLLVNVLHPAKHSNIA